MFYLYLNRLCVNHRFMRSSIFLVFLSFFAASCISNKKITLLQNLPGNEPIGLDEFIPYAPIENKYILQPYDFIDIDFAADDEELIKGFEFQGARNVRGGMMGGAGGGGDIFFFSGYGIDKDGMVEIPHLGKIKIAGLTEEEARNKVQEAMDQYFKKGIFVRLRIGGIRYTTMGEFRSVGNKVVFRNRVNIFEALANAGEPNILAKREKLFLIRQYDGGTKIHQINLNDRALLSSPFYFIQNNDILYLEPMKVRQYGQADNLLGLLQISVGLLVTGLFLINLNRGN